MECNNNDEEKKDTPFFSVNFLFYDGNTDGNSGRF